MNSDDFKEFDEQLQKTKKRLEDNILNLKDEMESIVLKDDINDMEDMASVESESMHHRELIKQQQHELDEVIHALSKIKSGTYGVCEESGDSIPLDRLRAEPHTRYCLKYAMKIEK